MTDYRLRPNLESEEQTLERLKRAAEAAEIGTFYVPIPIGRLYWNIQCKQHFWLSSATPDSAIRIGTFYRSIHPDDRRKVRAAIQASIESGMAHDVEFRTTSAKGDLRWLRAKGSASFVAGRPVRLDGITIDVSVRKRLEEERNALLDSERMLRFAAQSANEAKDAFLAAISHELRAPLTAVLAWADLIAHGSHEPGFVNNGISVIRRNVLAQTRLVDDLLDMGRVANGKFSVRQQRLSIDDCLYSALQDVRPIADAKGVFVADLVAEPIDVLGDGPRLRQVFANLLSNALKHTERGGKIMPSLVARGASVHISIADTGRGIPPDMLTEVFEPFVQVKDGERTNAAGLGLGLSIARSIVLLHGGDITAQSGGAGKGATFTVVLPIAGQQPAAERTPQETVLHRSSLKGKTILLVEDDADSREAISMVLQYGDAHVHMACSAEQAREVLTHVAPDAIVTDLTMPGEDGYTFMKRLREEAHTVPVIALTGHVLQEDVQRATDAGFAGFLGKPVDPAKLLAAVAQILGD